MRSPSSKYFSGSLIIVVMFPNVTGPKVDSTAPLSIYFRVKSYLLYLTDSLFRAIQATALAEYFLLNFPVIFNSKEKSALLVVEFSARFL
jgi:hypothetical protein